MQLSPEKHSQPLPQTNENTKNQNRVETHNTSQQERLSYFIPANTQPPKQHKKAQKQTISIKIFEQRLDKATQLKNNGNALFKKKDFVGAIKQYSAALQLLDPNFFYGASQVQCHKMAELSATLLCNMGYSYFNSHDLQRAELFFNQAIIINPKYVKALHKRALTRYQLQKYEQSFEDIKLAFSLQKSNAQVHQAYSKILQKYNQIKKKNNEKLKQLSSKIFSNDTQKSNSPTKKQNHTLKKSQVAIEQRKQETQGRSWSWPSMIAFAGAAAFIGAGIFKAFKG